MNDERDATHRQAEFWPGFTVKCDRCGSLKVELDNSLGWSETSGGWGSVDMVCKECEARTSLVEA